MTLPTLTTHEAAFQPQTIDCKASSIYFNGLQTRTSSTLSFRLKSHSLSNILTGLPRILFLSEATIIASGLGSRAKNAYLARLVTIVARSKINSFLPLDWAFISNWLAVGEDFCANIGLLEPFVGRLEGAMLMEEVKKGLRNVKCDAVHLDHAMLGPICGEVEGRMTLIIIERSMPTGTRSARVFG